MNEASTAPVLQATEAPAAPAPTSRNVLGVKISLHALDGGQHKTGPFSTVEFVRAGNSRAYYDVSLPSFLRALRCLRNVGRDVVGEDAAHAYRWHMCFTNLLRQDWEGRQP